MTTPLSQILEGSTAQAFRGLTTAYNLLRMQGVAIGKRDYMGV